MLAFHSPVKQGRVADDGIEIEVGGAEPMNLRCRLVVNSRRPACADAGKKNRRHAIRSRADRVLRQRKLFHLGRTLALLAPDLSRPRAGRARRAHHRRHGRPGQVRPGRRMDRRHRLHRRSAPRRQVLCRRAPLLARPQGRRAAAGLCRHPAQDRAAGRAGPGLRRAGPGRSWRARPHQPLRHRIARPHRLAGAGRAGARHRRRRHDLGPARPLRRPRGSARRLLSGHAAQRHGLAPGLYARSATSPTDPIRARSSISTGPTSRAPTARR